jgi:2-methylisocitrate lyase-like PEP mutase family enzyme
MDKSAQAAKAEAFARLHKPGEPIMLVNIWDVASAGAVAKAGAKALATSSAAVALAHGYEDGEKLPRELLLAAAARISTAHDLPLTVDSEAGYGRAPGAVAETVALLIAAGAIGMNLEDQVIGESGLYPVADQAQRIKAARQAADKVGPPFFINARTDVFLKARRETHAGAHVEAALERARAYAAAGASGIFVPGVVDLALIAQICAAAPLPVNVMAGRQAPSAAELAKAGVARISLGPWPFRAMLDALEKLAVDYHRTGVFKSG